MMKWQELGNRCLAGDVLGVDHHVYARIYIISSNGNPFRWSSRT